MMIVYLNYTYEYIHVYNNEGMDIHRFYSRDLHEYVFLCITCVSMYVPTVSMFYTLMYFSSHLNYFNVFLSFTKKYL